MRSFLLLVAGALACESTSPTLVPPTGDEAGLVTPPVASVNVLTWHNDVARTGQDPFETILSPATVNAGTFGKLFSLGVDGQIYAQPLYVSGVVIGGSMHDVVIVATEHDSVYAITADSGALLWHTSFIDEAHDVTTIPASAVSSKNISPEIGITSTPVIDPTTNIVYVLARTKLIEAYSQSLHALDLATGAERNGGPVIVSPNVDGTGDGSLDGGIAFDSLIQNQRSALALANGQVYVAWASHGDQGPFHGWIAAFDASTLAATAVLNTTPDNPSGTTAAGGVWMSGAGLASDGASLYASTGNGYFDATNATAPNTEYGDCLLKLSPSLAVTDFFTPYNQASLAADDLDLGSSGVVILPDQPGAHPHEMIAGGKAGFLYVVDRDSLGRYNQVDAVVEVVPTGGALFGTPAYFNGRVYFKSTASPLTSIALASGTLDATSIIESDIVWAGNGSTPSISSNGDANGVVWVIDAGGPTAILRAFDANDVANEIYDSGENANDALDAPVKFSVPTIARGRVFVGTSSALNAFGFVSR